LNTEQLRRYLRNSYVLRYVDRRAHGDGRPTDCKRGPSRRLREVQIDFLERRRVAFADAPVSPECNEPKIGTRPATDKPTATPVQGLMANEQFDA